MIETSSYDVVKGFEESVRHVQRTLSLREHTGAAAVELGDARGLPLEDCSIDLTITSPPYLNAIDYMRGHKLALVWLGHTLSELRSIRSTTIGAERRQAGDLDHRTADLLKPVMAGAANPSGLPIRTLERYAHDLAAFSEELFRVMRPGAKVVAVIGNSSVKGNYIKNDAVLALALEAAGFTITGRVERALPAGHRYLPSVERTANEALGKRMNSEIILTASRS